MRIKKGDTVKILSGKDRNTRAKVIRVYPREGRILVEGVYMKKRHRRARRQDRRGEIMLIPAPIAASAAQVICPSCGKPARMGYRVSDAGKKERWCKKCKAAI